MSDISAGAARLAIPRGPSGASVRTLLAVPPNALVRRPPPTTLLRLRAFPLPFPPAPGREETLDEVSFYVLGSSPLCSAAAIAAASCKVIAPIYPTAPVLMRRAVTLARRAANLERLRVCCS